MITFKKIKSQIILIFLYLLVSHPLLNAQTYKIVDTGQSKYYDNQSEITAPELGANFYGQDASINGHQPNYTDNGDGTVTDNVTGLMWQQSTDLNGDGIVNIDDKLS